MNYSQLVYHVHFIFQIKTVYLATDYKKAKGKFTKWAIKLNHLSYIDDLKVH